MISVCLYDHHEYVIPTDGIGGVIGLFQILYKELKKYPDISLTVIVNNNSTLSDDINFKVLKLPIEEINNIRYGKTPITKYFNGDIFYTNSSGRHVNFDLKGFGGKWISVCHGCQEWVGGSDCQVFVSNNQLMQHFRDGLFDTYSNNYRVVHGAVDTDKLFYTDGPHDRIVWMGRIDGAKAERLYDIARDSKEKILAAGWYTNEWEWLFQKIMNTGNVDWVGKITGDSDKLDFYRNAKVSIHCSTFEDPCPTTVLESQACGVPVISYANGSMREISLYNELIFTTHTEFIQKLNTFDSFMYSNKDLCSFIQNYFCSEVYGKNFYKIFREVYEKNY